MVQKRFQVKNTEMIMFSINKMQFARLNDKTYIIFWKVLFPLLMDTPDQTKYENTEMD